MPKKTAKWILLAAIALVIVGIGVWKNVDFAPAPTAAPTPRPDTAAETSASPDPSPDGTADQTARALEISSVDLDALIAAGLPILLDFGSDTCPPCLLMEEDLKSVFDRTEGKATVHYINVNANYQAASGFPIMVTPTQVFINADGTPFLPSEQLLTQIEFAQYSFKDTGELAYTVHQGLLTEEQMLLILREMGAEV